MREILFRGKAGNGKWVEGGYHLHQKITPAPIIAAGEKPEPIEYAALIIQSGFSDWCLPKPISAIEVDKSTVGQYTGLTDKNGKKIFEGDVIQLVNCDGDVVRVTCEFGTFERKMDSGATVMIPGFAFVFDDGFPSFPIKKNYIGVCDTEIFEVIGNIHDNPELLEESK